MAAAKHIRIGARAGTRDHVDLPIDLATDAIAVVGRRSSGKSHFSRVGAEEMLDAGLQVVVVDPLDCWWGLKSSKSGKAAGYNIAVFGGERGDLPLPETSGKVLAEVVVRERISAVLSLRHMSKSAGRRFVADFCEALFHLKGRVENRTPLHVFVDEADMFVPQRVLGEDARCHGAVDNLVRRGRTSGVGVSLITQRPAVISKDVLTQAQVLVSFQLTGPQDKRAVESWIEDVTDADKRKEKEVVSSLASLKRGEAWVWAPASLGLLRVEVRDTRTFDSSFTPRLGEARPQPRTLAQVDVPALEKLLESTVEEARASDPTALRRRVKELEAALLARGKSHGNSKNGVPAAEVAQLTKRISELERGQQRECAEAAARAIEAYRADVFAGVEMSVNNLHSLLSQAVALLKPYSKPVPVPELVTPAGARRWLRDNAPKFAGDADGASGNTTSISVGAPAGLSAAQFLGADADAPDLGKNLGSGKDRMLLWLARHHPNPVSKKKLAMLCGMSPRSGTYSTYLSDLRSSGLIEYPNNSSAVATQAGVDKASPFPPMPSGGDLLNMWRNFIGGGGQLRIFDAMVNGTYGDLTPERLGEVAGISHKSGTFSTYVSALRKLGIMEPGWPARLSKELTEAIGI